MSAIVVNGVVERLKAAAPSLGGRVGFVADLSALIAAGNLPARSPAAYVLALGESAGEGAAMVGAQRQRVDETIGVVLVHAVHGDGATGAKSQSVIDAVADEVRQALLGWSPDDDVFAPVEYRRLRPLGLEKGAVVLQLEFATWWLIYA